MRRNPTNWLILLALTAFIGSAWALDVQFDQDSLTIQKTDATKHQVGVLIKDFPGGETLGSALFYLVYDKTALEISDVTWDNTILDLKGLDTPLADGLSISGSRLSAAGSVDPGTAIVTFNVTRLTDTAGTYPISFKVGNGLNALKNLVNIDIAVDSWDTLNVTVSEGPPDPVQGLDSFTYDARQGPNLEFHVDWSAPGKADNFEPQYSEDGGATWQDPDSGVTIDVPNKKISIATSETGTVTVKVRVRATDQGMVWDGTAAVDAATNPDAGWLEGATDLTIDGEPPAPQSAATNLAGDKITVNFQSNEVLDNTTSADPANYQLSPAGGLTITGATRLSDNSVELTLDGAVERDVNYQVGCMNVADSLGNASATLQQVAVTITPNPVRDLQVDIPADRSKDPVAGSVSFTSGFADDGEARYSTDGGATWTACDPKFSDDVNFEWTTGLTGTKNVILALRGIDQGYVWNGSAAVEAATNPDVGWAQDTVIVDNENPVPESAAGAGNMVEVVFKADEALHATDVQDVGHYTVTDQGVITNGVGDVIAVTSAALKAGTKNIVELQLASDLLATQKYQVAIQNVTDEVGNAMDATVYLDVQTEPKPGKNVAVALNAGARQKDDVVVDVTWTDGFATELQLQYSDDGGTTWKAATGAVANIGEKKFTWATGFAGVTAIQVRARVIHRGMVWDGTQNVDAATNPDTGWSAAANLTVDNAAPDPQSIVANRGENTVTINFQGDEELDQTTAENAANYTVRYEGPITAAGAYEIGITGVVLTAPNVVKLTIGEVFGVGNYKVTVNAAVDTAGNALAAPEDFALQFKPNPEVVSAAFIAKNQVSVTFDKEMKIATMPAADWSISTAATTGVDTAATVAVQSIADSGDGMTFILTTDVMAQKTNYTVTAPADSEDTDSLKILATARTADFTSRRWFDFTTGTQTIGIPLTDTGRVLDMTGAVGVAAWDTGASDYIIDKAGAVTNIMNEAGKGFFAKFNGATTGYFDGDPLTGAVTFGALAGWNLITPPRDISLANTNPAIPYAWYYGANGYELKANIPAGGLNVVDNKLNAWEGYFIKKGSAGDVQIGTAAAQSVATLSVGGDDAKLVQFVAQAGDAVDATNFCGIGDSEATVANPPLVDGSVDLAFVGKDGQSNAVDVRTGDVCQTWDMVVTTSLPNTKVTVSAPDLSALPGEYAVTLTDKSNGKSCYLRTSQGYTFESGADGAAREFSVSITPRAAGSLVGTVSVQAAPGNKAVITYGLNSTAAVSAEVLNIAGRSVRRIVADRVESAGTHTLVWNLNSDAGTAVPRGLYMIVVQARSEDGQQVKAVRPLSVNR